MPKIIVYLKPTCPWSKGVRATLRKYNLPFEERDVTRDPAHWEEMVRKSGQTSSPCVEVDGHLLADVGGEEVEAYLLAQKLGDAGTGGEEAHPRPPGNAG